MTNPGGMFGTSALGLAPGGSDRGNLGGVHINAPGFVNTGVLANYGTVNMIAPPPAQLYLHQLPPDLPAFVGRAAELARVLWVLGQPPGGEAATIVVICGPPGIGRTTLAIHAATMAADRYPDAQLFVDLGGDGDAVHALSGVLRAFGCPATGTDLAELQAQFRSEVRGKRVILVLDGATRADQVAALIPAAAGCAVVVTSDGPGVAPPGAEIIRLGTLSEPDAVALLESMAGADRLRAAPDATKQIVALLGGLPLDLSAAGRLLALQPDLDLAAFAAMLAAQPATSGGITFTAVALSMAELGLDDAIALRLLALVPGRDLPVEGMAALFGSDRTGAAETVERLVDHGLAVASPGPRYGVHEAIRAEATRWLDRSGTDEQVAAARDRLLEWWLAGTAGARRAVQPAPDEPPLPSDGKGYGVRWQHALDWLDGELPNLSRVVSAGDFPAVMSAQLAAESGALLRAASRWAEAESIVRNGLARAEAAADSGAQSACWSVLGDVAADQGRSGDAVAAYRQARDLARAAGDDRTVALSSLTLAGALARDGDPAAALPLAADTLRWAGEQRSPGIEMAALSLAAALHAASGAPDAAAADLCRARTLAHAAGDRRAEGIMTADLGVIRAQQGRGGDALAEHVRGLTLLHDVDERAEGQIRTRLAELQAGLGYWDEAEGNLTAAVNAAARLDDRRLRSWATADLAILYANQGRLTEASAAFNGALDLMQALGDEIGSALLETKRAGLDVSRARPDLAIAGLRRSLERWEALGNSQGRIESVSVLALVYVTAGLTTEAEQAVAQALELARHRNDHDAEGRVLMCAAAVQRMLGNIAVAQESLVQSVTAFQQAGDPTGEAWSRAESSGVHAATGNWTAALDQAGQAVLQAKRATANHALVTSLVALGFAQQGQRMPAESAASFDEALRVARSWSGGAIQAEVMGSAAAACMARGRVSEAVGYLRPAIVLAQAMRSPALLALLKAALANALGAQGSLDEAAALLYELNGELERAGDRRRQVTAAGMRALNRGLAGKPTEADQWSAYAVAVAKQLGDPQALTQALYAAAMVLIQQQRFDEAINTLDESLPSARSVADRHAEIAALTRIAAIRRMQGRASEALEAARQADGQARARAYPDSEAYTALELGMALAVLGNEGDALACLERAANGGQRLGLVEVIQLTAEPLATIYLRRGRAADANRCLTEALGLARAMGDRMTEAGALSDLGFVAMQTGDPVTARGHLEQALAIFDSFRAPQAANVKAMLSQLAPAQPISWPRR